MIIILSSFLLISWISPSISIENDLKNKILNEHNTYRRQVAKGEIRNQPKAADMREMVWSDELAETAERSGNKCVFEHDTDEERQTKSFPDAGQNIYAGWEPKDAVKMWFDENKDYSYQSEGCNGVCGHYTQIVWANSYAVGCASVHCEGRNGFEYKYLVVCNYGPAGNYMGEKPYSAGKPCSKCPSGSTCNDGLCSKSGSGNKIDTLPRQEEKGGSNSNGNTVNQKPDNRRPNSFNRFGFKTKFPGIFDETEIDFNI